MLKRIKDKIKETSYKYEFNIIDDFGEYKLIISSQHYMTLKDILEFINKEIEKEKISNI